ncbi:Tnks [Symbiodinium sp. CCMP2456]|nr:Tnks [Symbiodinium sp. CCMP2456]
MGSGASKTPTAPKVIHAAPEPVKTTSSRSPEDDAPKGDVPRISQRSEVSASGDDALPEYWYHSKGTADHANSRFDDMFYAPETEHAAFEEMLNESYVAKATQDRPCPTGEHGKTPGGCPCVQPGADPGLPTRYRVRRVIRVEASDIWRRYVDKRNAIRESRDSEGIEEFNPPPLTRSVAEKYPGTFAPLDNSVNEVYAYHGTFVRYALSIAENDFKIEYAGSSTGTLYGRGAYLGESITKADEYAKDEPDGYYDGVFAVLVCRLTMGKMNCTKGDPKAGERVMSGEFDSTCGTRLFRELVVYDADQCYPEYLVLYQRVYAKDDEHAIEEKMKRKFFMQIPLHWKNVATNLTKDRFSNPEPLEDAGKTHMQCLVNQSRVQPSRTLLRAERLEDADLWEKWVSVKADLHERLAEDEQLAEDLKNLGFELKVNMVEKDLRALTKRPCKFLKKGCRKGDKCRFSHNEFAADLGEEGLAAGRRLPVDELDKEVHEAFLWMACSTEEEAEEIGKGQMKISKKYGYGAHFYESLNTALKAVRSKDGTKIAILCRVICGVPSDNPEERDGKDCIILKVDENKRKEVLVKDFSGVYPEYFLALFAQEDLDAEQKAAETNSQHSGISGSLPLPGNDGGDGDERKSDPAEDPDDAVSEAASEDVSEAASVRDREEVADSDETFVVLWHEGWGDVKDEAFNDLDEANERFDMLDGGAYATILVNGRFNELRYYGTRGEVMREMYDHFWSNFYQGDDMHKPPFFIIATNVDGEAYGDEFSSLEDASDNIEEYNLPLIIVDSKFNMIRSIWTDDSEYSTPFECPPRELKQLNEKPVKHRAFRSLGHANRAAGPAWLQSTRPEQCQRRHEVEVELKLVFANDHNSATFAVALKTSVKEVKRLILQRHWPSSPNLIPATQVDRIRLFAAGKELGGKGTDDVKSLKDANILLSKNGPTPVHVMAVQKDITAEKSATTTENSSKSTTQCHCTLL